jgi:hypothetical protein
MAEDLAKYCRNRFAVEELPSPPVLPLQDEAHVDDWREYLDQPGDDLFRSLQSRLVQLNIPIRKGISKTAAYGEVVRRGHAFDEAAFGGRLTLERPELFSASVHNHPVGSLPVLIISHRKDFETVVRALAFRCEPATINPTVNAHLISGLINWDRMRRYKSFWMDRHKAAGVLGWSIELKRVTSSESWRYLDRLIVVTDSPYSGVSADELGLDWNATEWRERSAALRLEHEFTHYATKRLYGKMTLNVFDEIIADWAGISMVTGQFRAAWFLRFLGLDGFPTVRTDGRIHTYRGKLSDQSFRDLGTLALKAADGLEALHDAHYSAANRARFLLALTRLSLDLLASERREQFFGEAFDWAVRMLEPDCQ